MSFQPERLSAPIQVAGHGTIGNKLAMFAAVIGLVAAAIIATHDKWIAAIILVSSLLVLLTSLTIAGKRFRVGAFVLVSEEGFIYRDRHGESSYTDDQVVGVNVISKPNYRQGVLKSYTNEVELKVADREKPLKLETTTKLDQTDPLSRLVQRTIENYCERAEMALDAGARLTGPGWSLGRDDLAAEGTDATRAAIRDLVAIDTVDGEHKVWRKGQDAPMLSVPVKSDNAFLLSLLLAPKIAETRQQREFDIAQPGLGRQIFRRATGRFGRCFAWFCIMFSVLVIPMMVAAAIAQEPTLMVLSFAAVFLAPFALLLGLFLLRNEFRCHERGVYRRSIIKKQKLRFEDVESFKYNALRQYYNGAYIGTSLEVVFYPTASSGKKKLRYSRMVQNADDALEGLREHVTLILMPKLTQTLNTTGAVQWMPNVRITHEGLYYRPKGFVSRKEEQFLNFADVTGFDVDEGTLHVWRTGADKSVIQEATSEPNFYPGYMLLTTMYWANRTDSAEEA